MLFGTNINYLAVLVAAIAAIVIGSLWYSPILFGNIWMKLSGITKEKMEKDKKKGGMTKLYVVQIVASLVMACVLANLIALLGLTGVVGGIQIAFLVWVGFVLPLLIGNVLWEGKSWALYLLNITYNLVNLIVMGIILAVWR